MRRINFKNFVLAILIMTSLVSCGQSNYERKVYLDLKLGSSKSVADNFYKKFMASSDYKNTNSKYPYYTHTIKKNGIAYSYYSSPLYFYEPSDTIIHKVIVSYFLKPEEGDEIVETARQGDAQATTINEDSRLNDNDVTNDILLMLQKKYGIKDSEDTFHIEGGINVLTRWNNKNGINILFTHRSNYMSSTKYYFMSLKFTYTDELNQKLFKKQNIY